MNCFQPMSVAEWAIHFWRKGLQAGEVLVRVDYMVVHEFARLYPGFTNVISNVPRIPVEEVVYGTYLTEYGRRRMLGPEQKSIALLNDLVQKFAKPCDMMLDAYASTLSTTKMCLLMNRHRRFCGI